MSFRWPLIPIQITGKHVMDQKNLKQWLSDRWVVLLLICIVCFSVLAVFSWLNGITAYGQRHFSLYSPRLDILLDLSYRDNMIFFSMPKQGISSKIPYWRLAVFGKKYWLPLKITIYNILFLTFFWQGWRTIKNRRNLIKRFKEFLHRPGHIGLLFICKAFIAIIFLLSIFPAPHFNFWWKKFSFITPGIKPPTLALALYDFMTNLLIFRTNRLFYASLFVLPHFILKCGGISCLILLILGKFKLPSTITTKINQCLSKLSALNYKKCLAIACALVFVLANLISLIANQHLPAYAEGVVQLFQGRLLAMGKLAQPISFSREFFEFPLLNMDTHWYSTLAPGQSFLLALGNKLGISWLINPVLGSLVLVTLYLLVNKVYGFATAMLATLFMIFSPLYLSLSASHLSHLPFILFFLLALLFYHNNLENPGKLYPILSGLCWGLAALTRPLSALAVALPFIVHLIRQSFFAKATIGLRMRPLFVLAGLIIPLGLLITYNQILPGNPWRTGLNLLGKGLESPLQGLFYIMNNLWNFNEGLWGLVIPAFFLILIWVLVATQLEALDYLLLWTIFCLVAFNFLAYDTRLGLVNPLIIATPLVAILSARAIMSLPRAMTRFGFSPQNIKPLLALGLSICCMVLLSVKLPPLLHAGDSHRHNLAQLIKEENPGKSIIFLPQKPYRKTFAHNRPDLSNDIIFARHLKSYNRKLMREFPGRSYYFYNVGENKLIALSPE